MSKSHRGTGIRNDVNHGRGVCAICGAKQIKVLYDQEIDGKKVVDFEQENGQGV